MTAAPKYTHGHSEAVLRSHRWRTAENSAAYLLPRLRRGQRLLDIGAGPGTITADLAECVKPGRVTALETSDDALALSRAELGSRGIAADFVVGDVHALDMPDDSFDVVHAHQVLQHVADPVQALREMRRVCRPGGVVAVRDSDYRAFAWHPQHAELDRWMEVYQAAARANGGEPDAGRRLKAWAREAGFEQVTATASTWCFTDAADRAYWGGMWADRIVTSALSDQLLADGLSTRAELEAISAAWRAWTGDPDGWIALLHGEILATC